MRVLAATGVQAETLPFAGLHQLLEPVLDLADLLPQQQRDALLGAFGIVRNVDRGHLRRRRRDRRRPAPARTPGPQGHAAKGAQRGDDGPNPDGPRTSGVIRLFPLAVAF